MGGAGDFPSAPPRLTLSDSMKFLSQDRLLLAWSPQPRTAWLDCFSSISWGEEAQRLQGRELYLDLSAAALRALHLKHFGLLNTQHSLCHYLKIYLFTTLVASCWNEEIVAGSEYWVFKVFPCLKSSKNSAFSLLSSSARLLISLGRMFLPKRKLKLNF